MAPAASAAAARSAARRAARCCQSGEASTAHCDDEASGGERERPWQRALRQATQSITEPRHDDATDWSDARHSAAAHRKACQKST